MNNNLMLSPSTNGEKNNSAKKHTTENIPLFGMVLSDVFEVKSSEIETVLAANQNAQNVNPDLVSQAQAVQAKMLNSNAVYEPLVMWIVKGHNNAKVVHSLIKGEYKFNLAEENISSNINQNSYMSKKCTISTYGNLSLQDAQPLTNYNAMQEVYCNTFEVGNLVFVPKDVKLEDEESFILNSVITVFKERYPIPTQKEWEAGVFKTIVENLIELPIVGNTPFKKVLKIKYDLGLLETIVVEEYSKFKFKEKFNNVPRLNSLLYMLDLDKFNVKKWQAFLIELGGPEVFKEMSFNVQKEYVYLFECFQEHTKDVLEIINEYDTERNEITSLENLDSYSIAKNLLKEKFFNPLQAIKAIKSLMKYILDNNKDIAVNNTLLFKKIFHIVSKEDKYEKAIKSPKAFFEEIYMHNYEQVDPRCANLAIKASSLLLDYQTYLLYEQEYLKNIKALKEDARYYPTISGKVEGTDYTWECIDLDNPNAWFVGLETNCCQHLKNAGATCVQFAAANPGISGIMRVMKNKKTVAQSFMWMNIEQGTMVFDNIEALGEGIRTSILDAYLSYISKITEMKIFRNIQKFTVGLGCNDIETLNRFPKVPESSMVKLSDYSKFVKSNFRVYSDAKSAQVYLKK